MIYQLKIVLKNQSPLIWVRLQLDGKTTLATLQDDLDEAFDLSKMGVHHFKLSTISRDNSVSFPENTESPTAAFYESSTLNQCFYKRGYIGNDTYQNDVCTMVFNLFIEQIIQPEKGIDYPRCTTVCTHLSEFIVKNKPWFIDPLEGDLVQEYATILTREELVAHINAFLKKEALNPFDAF
ncbi:MAG: hypothetical protein ABF629_07765 [Sporolactobacillus sp.]